MSECLYRIVCPFYRHQIPIHTSMYQQYVSQYCNGDSTNCAILMVMSLEFSSKRTTDTARRLFFGSILYLPILWALLVFDHRANF